MFFSEFHCKRPATLAGTQYFLRQFTLLNKCDSDLAAIAQIEGCNINSWLEDRASGPKILPKSGLAALQVLPNHTGR